MRIGPVTVMLVLLTVPHRALALQGVTPDTAPTVPDSVTAARVLAGSDVFNGGSCVACHAVGGRGTGRRGPNLSDAEWLQGSGSLEDIRHTIFWGVQKKDFRAVTPRPFQMNPQGGMRLDREQLLALSAYVWSLSRPSTSAFVSRQERFLDLLRLGLVKEGLALFGSRDEAGGEPPLLPEGGLNALGYELLRRGDGLEGALAVFQLNVELHPDSWNVYDSLGEGLAAAGNVDEAISAYQESLRRNPQNDHARKAIDALREKG